MIQLSDLGTLDRKQPFGTRAKQTLPDLAFGQEARVVKVTTDRHGKIVARDHVDVINMNRELVMKAMPGCSIGIYAFGK